MTAYNFRLHDEVMAALKEEIDAQMINLAMSRLADFGEYRYRVGMIAGLRQAMDVAEETRKKVMKE